jgi:hypothetical protein
MRGHGFVMAHVRVSMPIGIVTAEHPLEWNETKSVNVFREFPFEIPRLPIIGPAKGYGGCGGCLKYRSTQRGMSH